MQDLNWLYFDLNSYFATIEQQVDPSLRGKPVVVVPLLSDSTCAIAASYEAKLKDIKTGAKIYEAKKLCPELICIKGRRNLYVEYHKRIFLEINKLLFVDAVCSIDEGAGRLTGKYQQEEEAIRLAQNIKLAIKQNVGDYITCSIGIAPTKYLAKIAAEMEKPDGLTVITAENIPSKLLKLSLRYIPGVGYRVLKRLRSAGIDTVEKLYGCSSGHLQTIWGSIYGKKCWYLLRGYQLAENVVKNQVIGHSRILGPEVRRISAARNVAAELAIKAAKRLREKELYATYIGLYLKTLNKVVHKTYVRISPSCDNATILEQVLKAWDRLTQQYSLSSLRQVGLSLGGLIQKPRQLSFDDLGSNQIKENLSLAMDNINKRFGQHTVNIGTLSNADREDPIAFAHIPGANNKEYLG
ncbi:MAG: DNA-directed DNA polymerase [Rickettsiales bacterium]|nr:DNA-directed DNA polymerase [Rickettsiales bacterium]